MTGSSRRQFVAGLGAVVGAVGLGGCLAGPLPGVGPRADRTVYVGAYHWGFVLLDEQGAEHERLLLDVGTTLRVVAFNTEAHDAVSRLPPAVRDRLPDHEGLEERNEARIPPPASGDVHEALEEANEQYPDHSLAVTSSGANHMRGPMGGGMMRHPLALPHGASRPATALLEATRRGDYTLSCLTFCGYGHPYMDLDGGFVVR